MVGRRLQMLTLMRHFSKPKSSQVLRAVGLPVTEGFISFVGIFNEVEFVTIMWFDSMDAVRAFAGEDYEVAVVPPKARALLLRFDARSQHYEVKAEKKT